MPYKVIKELSEQHPVGSIIHDEEYAAIINAMYKESHLAHVDDVVLAKPASAPVAKKK